MKINTKAVLKSALSLFAVVFFGAEASAQCNPPVGPVTISNIQTTTAGATWAASSSEIAGGQYEFEVLLNDGSLPGTNNEILSGFTSNGVTNILVTTLDFSTDYRFFVRYNCTTIPVLNASTWISSTVFTTATLTTPVATPATTVTDVTMRANWNVVPGADSYLFDLSTDNFATFVAGYNDFATTDNFVELAGLEPNTLYYYRVRAVGNNGSTSVTTDYSNTIVRSTLGPETSVYTWVGPSPGHWEPSEGSVDNTKDVIIDFDYDMNLEEVESFEAKNMFINAGYTVTITDGKYIRLASSLSNFNQGNEGLIVKSGGNFSQLFTGANNNVGGMKVERESFPLFRLDYTLWSSPTSGKPGQLSDQTLGEFSPATLTNRFYTYTSSTDTYSLTSPTTVFTPGIGYLIRIGNTHPEYAPATAGTTWTGQFEGAINGGTYTLPLSTAGQGYNAIGNPYPSLLSIDDFIIGNLNTTGTLYFWRRRNNTAAAGGEPTQAFYATYTLAGGVGVPVSEPSESSGVAPEPYTLPGQGFIVQVDPAATGTQTVTFNNSMRAVEVDDVPFFRANAQTNRYWLKVSYDQNVYNEMLVAYLPTATNDLDRADGKFIGDATIALTSLINNEEYVIQGRAPFTVGDVVPLYFRASATGNFTIAFDRADGIFNADQNIYLRDNLTNTVHNIKAAPYTFAAVAGTYSDRFEILYEMPLGVANPQFDANAVVVYKQNGAIQINAGATVISDVKVFDIRGIVVAQKNNVNATETSVNTTAENQVLIIQISSESNGTVSKKFVN